MSDARLAWEADRVGLESTIACLEGAKASADKDTAFFREQYANALDEGQSFGFVPRPGQRKLRGGAGRGQKKRAAICSQ
jgi:hypothetical protein